MRQLILLIIGLTLLSCRPDVQKAVDVRVEEIALSRSAIEFVLKDEAFKSELENFLDSIEIDLYQWKNHYLLFGEEVEKVKITNKILDAGNSVQVKQYDIPLYTYDKTKHCQDKLASKPWKNYLLTANLVEDEVLQQEYVDYHNTQFEKWPEVAQGFCNASFQQLLVFRSGRQLLLVITIPSDKTLEELDPLTLENNPRMVEWNTIMSKYQEGIEGTEPGETWVFLEEM